MSRTHDFFLCFAHRAWFCFCLYLSCPHFQGEKTLFCCWNSQAVPRCCVFPFDLIHRVPDVPKYLCSHVGNLEKFLINNPEDTDFGATEKKDTKGRNSGSWFASNTYFWCCKQRTKRALSINLRISFMSDTTKQSNVIHQITLYGSGCWLGRFYSFDQSRTARTPLTKRFFRWFLQPIAFNAFERFLPDFPDFLGTIFAPRFVREKVRRSWSFFFFIYFFYFWRKKAAVGVSTVSEKRDPWPKWGIIL